ncbi:MAG: hypothetical protein P4M00_18330 [Azospirillaceae bacterium]|nr:hypothetical protein [Azospirillaceae bacterium]
MAPVATKPDLILLEFGLSTKVGRGYNYCASIQRAVRRRGFSLRLFCHQSVPPGLAETLGAEPLFHTDGETPVAGDASAVQSFCHSGMLFRDLTRLDSLMSPRTTVFVHQLSPLALPGLSQWYLSLPVEYRPRLVVFLDCRPDNPCPGLFGFAVAALATAGPPGATAVRFCTDTAQAAVAFERERGRKADVVPIPAAMLPATAPVHPALVAQLKRLRIQRGVTVISLSLGTVARDKGFLMVKDIIAAIRIQHLPIRFIVQTRIDPHQREDHAPLEAAVKALKADRGTDLLLLDEELDETAYATVLTACDLVVLPYRSDRYRDRSSGIFADALAAAKTVIVPADTWMAGELVRFDAPGAVLHQVTPAAIGQAVAAIVPDRGLFHHQARAVATTWTAFHNAEMMVDYLFAGLDSAARADRPHSPSDNTTPR